MVVADKFKDMIPREPFLSNPSSSSMTSSSSLLRSGEARMIDLKSPTPLFE
jgi:hypothetical protein